MLVVLQDVGVAVVPLKVTVLEPWVPPKLVPVIVTEVPAVPEVGETLVMEGRTVNEATLLATALTVTTTFTFPAGSPAGTVTPMLVALHDVTLALTPPNVTVLLP